MTSKLTMADMPMQMPEAPQSEAAGRARFFNSANAFALKASDVPDHVFSEEPAAAMSANAVTGFIACDLSVEMDCEGPATAPLILARYGTILPGEKLTAAFAATASIWYVIRGEGRTVCGDEDFAWGPGDVFLLPGGGEHQLTAGPGGAVLWVAGNEPCLTFEGLAPPPEDQAVTPCVHYPAAEIERQLQKIYDVDQGGTAGMAILFSSDQQAERRNILPTLTLAMNSLQPGAVQPGHKHNSVAVALVINGPDCFSMIDGKRKDWGPWVTTVTPPGSVHSHHNEGDERALFLIVQDGGLHYHTRTMGFAFA
ncbi:MAG: cupin domain-containing protein [Alphaproteobacteria bacterium]|nr:cupin domain-containing protein [Alphaproteobacteria bacterium]